jgi:leader peptidase (prepilin peptidase)/N-methyltransferase
MLGLGAALWSAFQARVVVPRLAEPPDGQELDKKPYAQLPRPATIAPLCLISMLATLTCWGWPLPAQLVWAVYCSSIAVLAWVDALTTWVPRQLVAVTFSQLGIAQSAALALLGWRESSTRGFLIGGLLLCALFWLIWRFGSGLGYGDVLFGLASGAAGGILGFQGWYLSLLLGSLVGVCWGLVSRNHPAPGTATGFAYAPAMWTGPVLAAGYLQLAG